MSNPYLISRADTQAFMTNNIDKTTTPWTTKDPMAVSTLIRFVYRLQAAWYALSGKGFVSLFGK